MFIKRISNTMTLIAALMLLGASVIVFITCSSDDSGGHMHVFGTATVIRPVTATSAGEERRTCTICGESQTRPIPVPVPDTPRRPTVSVASKTSIRISWSSVALTVGYNVYRSNSSSGSYDKIAETANTSYTDTSVSQDTEYYYKVSAYNVAGESSLSPYASAEIALPEAPTDVTATVLSSTSIYLSWDEDSSGISLYRVYGSINASGPYTLIGNTATESCTVENLSPGIKYYFKVSAVNSIGESDLSSYVSATTLIN